MKLLIVEDNIKLLKAITGAIEAEQFVCETAADFAAANEKLFVCDYNILVADITLALVGRCFFRLFI